MTDEIKAAIDAAMEEGESLAEIRSLIVAGVKLGAGRDRVDLDALLVDVDSYLKSFEAEPGLIPDPKLEEHWQQFVASADIEAETPITVGATPAPTESKLAAAINECCVAFHRAKKKLGDLSPRFWVAIEDLAIAVVNGDSDAKLLEAVRTRHRYLGAPGDFGYHTPEGKSLKRLYDAAGAASRGAA